MDTETLLDGVQGERTHLSRTGRSVITKAARDRFAAAAHEVRPLLVTRLRRAGASPEDAEDVAQEALLRAWDRRIRFDDDGDLLRWCTVVARRSHIDGVRRQSRQRQLAEIPSESACRELDAVELRQVLGTVRTAMAELTEQEQASLRTSATGVRTDRATQVRMAVARHRARYRLRLLVGPFTALGTAAVRVLRRGTPAAAATTALAAAALSVTLTVPPDGRHSVGLPGSHPFRGAPVGTPPASGPRPAPPAVLVGLARPAAVRPAPATVAHRAAAPQPGVSFDQRPGRPDDPLVCIDDPDLGHVCVPPTPATATAPGPGPAKKPPVPTVSDPA